MSNSELIQIIYCSTSVRPRRPSELLGMLKISRRNNEHNKITGMVIYFNGCFIQVLEGPRDVTEATYGRISADPRHKDIYELRRRVIKQREFGSWSMGFRELGEEDLEEHRGAIDLRSYSELHRLLRAELGIGHRLLLRFCGDQCDPIIDRTGL